MSYEKQTWENLPSEETPISAERLNYMEQGIYDAFEEAAAKASKTIYADTGINLGRKAETTIGTNSVAEGMFVTASERCSHAEGYGTEASGSNSHAEGYKTEASGSDSHAEGNYTIASGGQSHAEGYYTTASECGSHAEGYKTVASGWQSHAEGNNTTASGYYAHSEGAGTEASETCAHAEGSGCNAKARYSHAEGYRTISGGVYQHTEGKYNVEDGEGKYAHIVGGGSSDTDRKNIHTLDWSGNAVFAGNVTDGNGNSIAGLKEAVPAEETVDIDFSNYFS